MDRFTLWINHGLKHARWPANRMARVALLLALLPLVAGIFLAQSGQIVTSSRHVESLQKELGDLQRDNARLLASISEERSTAHLKERATALGFRPAETADYVRVPIGLHDDMLPLRLGYLNP
jgi:hypothetical protein